MTHLHRTISNNLAILLSTISGVRDGQSDAIHNARVATRRLRGALPLAWAESPNTIWREGAETLRQLGRHLGEVREIDVALEQLPALEGRVPMLAPSIGLLRQDLARRHADQRRWLVKSVEELPLYTLKPDRLIPSLRVSLRADPRWGSIARAIVEHAGRLRQSIDRGSGVYFPNRTHRVRVETKKLRYLLELMTHAADARLAVKRLKRIQAVLGDLHDRQVLLDIVRKARVIPRRDRDGLCASLDAQCQELFQDYLVERPSLVDVCEKVRKAASRGDWRPITVRRMLLTVSVAAVSPVLLWLTRSEGATKSRAVPAVVRRPLEDESPIIVETGAVR